MPARPRLTEDDVGGWTLTCNPRRTDLDALLRDSGGTVERWCVRPSYRLGLMRPGQPVFLWVTQGGTPAGSGVWARGSVVEPPRHAAAGAPAGPVGAAPGEGSSVVRVDLTVRELLVPRGVVRSTPGLGRLELLRAPQMSNPQLVTHEEVRLLDELLSPAPQASRRSRADASDHSAVSSTSARS